MLSRAEAAPVRCDDMHVARQRTAPQLKGGRHLHPAVQHEEHGRILLAPVSDVITQATDGKEFGTRSFHGRQNKNAACSACGRKWRAPMVSPSTSVLMDV